MAALLQRRRCRLCVVRHNNHPLEEIDPAAAISLSGRSAKGKKHDASAPNCVKSDHFLSLCPACCVCGNGDKVTAAAVRDRSEPLEEVKCRLCLANDGHAVAVSSRAERRSAENAIRAETDAIHTNARTLDGYEEEDWNAVDPTTGLSKNDQLTDAFDDIAEESEAAGQGSLEGHELHLELARRVWPGLEGPALERKATLVQPRLSMLVDLSREKKLHTRNPAPKYYLPELEKLAKEPTDTSDRFHGMPAFVWYCMLALFVATLSTGLVCYALAERAVKWYNRKQAQGRQGIYQMIFCWRSHGARAAPLHLLEVVLRELGLRPYVGPTLKMAIYRGCVLGLIYALFGTSFSLVSVTGRVILLAGCVFGEKKQLAAIFGCTPRMRPGEPTVGFKEIGRPSRDQTQAVAYAMSFVTSGPGARVAFRVQRGPSAISPSFDPRGRNHGLGDTDRVFYVFGTNDRELKENAERILGFDVPLWLDGYADEAAGIQRWRLLKNPRECGNAIRGCSFSAAINNDRRLYVPRGPYGGRQLGNGFVVDIGRQLDDHPLTLAVLERANPINEASLRNQPYDASRFCGPENYCEELPERQRRAALEERTRLHALGSHAFAAQHLYSRYAKPGLLVAIGSVDQDAIKAATDRGDAAAVVALLTPVADAIKLGIERIGDALDAGLAEGKDWRAVAKEAGDELHAICEPRLAILPPETDIVPRGVALATLEEKAMQDAGWLVPAGRAVPNASGFAASAPRRRSYAEAVAGQPRPAAVGPPPRPAAVGPGSGSPRPKTKPRRWSFDSAEKEDAAASSMFTGLDIEDMCEDENISY